VIGGRELFALPRACALSRVSVLHYIIPGAIFQNFHIVENWSPRAEARALLGRLLRVSVVQPASLSPRFAQKTAYFRRI